MDLEVGKDYHLAEVRKSYRPKVEGTVFQRETQWFAYCTGCGWAGRVWDSKGAAEDDAAAHDNTEN